MLKALVKGNTFRVISFLLWLLWCLGLMALPPKKAVTPTVTPTSKQALYVNFWAASSKKYRQKLFKLIRGSRVNALVIDVKNEYGDLFYVSDIELAISIGAHQKAYVRDGPAYLQEYKNLGLYLIARIPVFKDNLLAQKHSEWAVRTLDGELWKDGQGLSWMDPYYDVVHSYNIQIALDVAKMGFDEVHFDYTRFPGINGLRYFRKNTKENRVSAINGFLQKARQQLATLDVKTSVATYGYTCWNKGDTYIGQQLDQLAKHVDYISPMLYPSSFQLGIPGYEMAVAHPYEIVLRSLQGCIKRSGLESERFRPWLQGFKDYSYDGRQFGAKEILKQIDAAEAFESAGWLLWNPASRYHKQTLPLSEP